MHLSRKVGDLGFDLGKAQHCPITAIGEPIRSCLQYADDYPICRPGGGSLPVRLAEIFWPKTFADLYAEEGVNSP